MNLLERYHSSGIPVWAFAFGCVIGWGAFVLPGSVFLPHAGPLGTVIGMTLGAVLSLAFCKNYSWMAHKYPTESGSYTYVKHILGEDHAFLVGWCILLAYISILWANAATITVLGRNMFGDSFQWGFHYSLFGYHIYGGEVIVSSLIVLTLGLIVVYTQHLESILRTVLALVLFISVCILFVGILRMRHHANVQPEICRRRTSLFASDVYRGIRSVSLCRF